MPSDLRRCIVGLPGPLLELVAEADAVSSTRAVTTKLAGGALPTYDNIPEIGGAMCQLTVPKTCARNIKLLAITVA